MVQSANNKDQKREGVNYTIGENKMSVGQVGHIKLDSEVWCKRLQPKQLRDLVGISIHFIPAGLPGKLKVLCWL